MVKNVMAMHGGSARAFSAGPGRGTKVTLDLPCIEQPAALQPAMVEPDSVLAKGKVLVVDDNQDAADSIGALLELAGYEVRVVYRPEAALALLSGFCPDAAVLDIGLPGMSGYELAAALRDAPHCFRGALVALTGYGEESDKAHALRSGFDAHLTKPAPAKALLELLASGLKTRR